MRRKTIHLLVRHTVWLSLLAHLLLFSGFSIIYLQHHPLPSASAPPSIPSYLSEDSPPPAAPPAPEENIQKAEPAPEPVPEPIPEQKPVEKEEGISTAKPKQAKAQQPAKPAEPQKPRKVTFDRNAVPENITNPMDNEPLQLVGESKIIKPLVKILARALSKTLRYPRVAADFNLSGVVLIGFTLDPNGYVTHAKVVQSSGAGVLDDAAVQAVGSMSPVGDVHAYVKTPEFLVIGIIFG